MYVEKVLEKTEKQLCTLEVPMNIERINLEQDLNGAALQVGLKNQG
jgi:hypothetical protein